MSTQHDARQRRALADAGPSGASGHVVTYPSRDVEPAHEAVVHALLGEKIAALLGMRYGGNYDPDQRPVGPLYFVPSATILGVENARMLGISNELDLFGGVASHAFVPTKAITHSLRRGATVVPEGWSAEFSRRVQRSVLAGVTAFSMEDARVGGLELLKRGALRVKPVLATAGRGQLLVTSRSELDAALEQQDLSLLDQCGLVLEEHLEEVQTYSAGQVRLRDMVISYVGTQRLTPDNHGILVYGGSDLIATRGGFDSLLHLELSDQHRMAISHAKVYDDAASACLRGFFASRRNYDIAYGRDATGQMRCGVLEQSWRIGGASAAEIAALETLHADPTVQRVSSSTWEIFGNDAPTPPGALELFHGVDPDIGLIRKYVTVQAYGHK